MWHSSTHMSNCNRKYTEQTDGHFYIRFKEHFHDYKQGNGKSKFSQHLTGNKYSIGSM